MEQEQYKDIVGYEGLYQISNYGNVRNAKTLRVLSIFYDRQNNGYARVSLFKGDGHKNFRIHRLVATHFIPNPNEKNQVNHINGDKSNNNVNNLEWSTSQENISHYHRELKNSFNYISIIKDKNNSCGYKSSYTT